MAVLNDISYAIGVDLGQQQDHTAFAVLESVEVVLDTRDPVTFAPIASVVRAFAISIAYNSAYRIRTSLVLLMSSRHSRTRTALYGHT